MENAEWRDNRDIAINASDAICGGIRPRECAAKNAAQQVAPRSLILYMGNVELTKRTTLC